MVGFYLGFRTRKGELITLLCSKTCTQSVYICLCVRVGSCHSFSAAAYHCRRAMLSIARMQLTTQNPSARCLSSCFVNPYNLNSAVCVVWALSTCSTNVHNVSIHNYHAVLLVVLQTGKQKGPKGKWKYLQKYWHKGAFFQENPDDTRGTAGTDAIFTRDFSDAVGEDKFDKSILPKVMQVKNFGRSGRTKWTHLLAEDTTAAAREDEFYRAAPKAEEKRGAVAGGFSRGGMSAGDKRGSTAEEFSKPKKFKT